MIITEIQYFFSKIIRFQAIFKDTVEFTCALEFKISSQLNLKDAAANLNQAHPEDILHPLYTLWGESLVRSGSYDDILPLSLIHI